MMTGETSSIHERKEAKNSGSQNQSASNRVSNLGSRFATFEDIAKARQRILDFDLSNTNGNSHFPSSFIEDRKKFGSKSGRITRSSTQDIENSRRVSAPASISLGPEGRRVSDVNLNGSTSNKAEKKFHSPLKRPFKSPDLRARLERSLTIANPSHLLHAESFRSEHAHSFRSNSSHFSESSFRSLHALEAIKFGIHKFLLPQYDDSSCREEEIFKGTHESTPLPYYVCDSKDLSNNPEKALVRFQQCLKGGIDVRMKDRRSIRFSHKTIFVDETNKYLCWMKPGATVLVRCSSNSVRLDNLIVLSEGRSETSNILHLRFNGYGDILLEPTRDLERVLLRDAFRCVVTLNSLS